MEPLAPAPQALRALKTRVPGAGERSESVSEALAPAVFGGKKRHNEDARMALRDDAA